MTRIIAGAAKGRRLEVPQAGTRPTSDRVREALFNTLASRVRLDGARVLDLYAGSGAVGLEALSRGAAETVLVESNARAAEVIARNIEAVGLPGARVVRVPVNRYQVDEDDEPFDLVFADPPYARARDAARLVALRCRGGWLAANGVVVIEAPRGVDPVAFGLSDITWFLDKRYGDTTLWYGRAR